METDDGLERNLELASGDEEIGIVGQWAWYWHSHDTRVDLFEGSGPRCTRNRLGRVLQGLRNVGLWG